MLIMSGLFSGPDVLLVLLVMLASIGGALYFVFAVLNSIISDINSKQNIINNNSNKEQTKTNDEMIDDLSANKTINTIMIKFRKVIDSIVKVIFILFGLILVLSFIYSIYLFIKN